MNATESICGQAAAWLRRTAFGIWWGGIRVHRESIRHPSGRRLTISQTIVVGTSVDEGGNMKFDVRVVGAALGAFCIAAASNSASAALIGPNLNYLGFVDSPFNGPSYTYFHLDTFESGALTAPGVTASAGSVVGPGPLVDSVDGGGTAGHSFFANGPTGITFTFDKTILGQLPTDAGIVWTDGDGPNRTFTAFDQNGVSLGTIIDSTQKFFSTGGDDDPSNYRFFGATNAGGISSIFIANDSGGIEVDHLQFGLRSAVVTDGVPEPTSWVLMILGFGGIGAALRRNHRLLAQ
ncbi:MAG: PEPxxWA-CTERM sorting domain-containing protein [Caulobacterales bacterium]